MALRGRLEGAANPYVEPSEQDVHAPAVDINDRDPADARDQRRSERISTQNTFAILPVNNAAFAQCLHLARIIEEDVERGVYEKSEITATIVATESGEFFIGVNSKSRDMRLDSDIRNITNQMEEASQRHSKTK